MSLHLNFPAGQLKHPLQNAQILMAIEATIA